MLRSSPALRGFVSQLERSSTATVCCQAMQPTVPIQAYGPGSFCSRAAAPAHAHVALQRWTKAISKTDVLRKNTGFPAASAASHFISRSTAISIREARRFVPTCSSFVNFISTDSLQPDESWTLVALKAYCREHGISGYSRRPKKQLLVSR
jgi:hypothetical protein